MWPLSTRQLSELLGSSALGGLKPESELLGLSTDSRSVSASQLYIPLKGERFDGHDFLSNVLGQPGCCALVSKSWLQNNNIHCHQSSGYFAVEDVLDTFRKLAGNFRDRIRPKPCVAVGGSNGKTTTKEMLSHILGGEEQGVVSTMKSENGIIGIPKTLCASNVNAKLECLVVEVGIDEVGTMEQHMSVVRPDITLLTSIAEEHLEGLINLETVLAEEMKLMTEESVRIWQMTDSLIFQEAGKHLEKPISQNDWCVGELGQNQIPASCQKHLQFKLTSKKENGLSPCVSVEIRMPEFFFKGEVPITLPGFHNASNFALAFAAAVEIKQPSSEIEMKTLLDGFSSFKAPSLRSSLETFENGNSIYVDCYNSNPASLSASLKLMTQNEFTQKDKFLFLGDMLDLGVDSRKKHLEIADLLVEMAEQSSLQKFHLFLFGKAMRDVFDRVKNQTQSLITSVHHFSSEEDPNNCIVAEKQLFEAFDKPTVALVKGSRGMQLERLLPALRNKLNS